MVNKFQIVGLVLLGLFSCSTKVESNLNFDFDNPEIIMKLTHQLDEISGIASLSENVIVGLNDEKGIIYQLDLINNTEEKIISFKKKGDFEGITIVGDLYYAINSRGDIFQIRKDGEKEVFKFDSDEFEFEGLAFNKESNSLLLACKKTTKKKLKNRILVFEFDLKSKQMKEEYFLDIEKQSKIDTFRPSGISLDKEGDVYLVSAAGAMIAKFSKEGNLIGTAHLPYFSFPQIEGICFDHKGDLYLSSEKSSGEYAKIVKFKHHD